MKVSREKALENRDRVVDTAAGLLREHGYDGVGVADLMQAAGLTHGGFYRNFASKDDLIVRATERALAASQATLEQGMATAPDTAFATLVRHYVSAEHCRDRANGCILPALAGDAARRADPALHDVFVTAVAAYRHVLDAIDTTMPDAVRARDPAAILAQMVGAVVLARAMGGGPQADAVLDAVVHDLTAPLA